MNWPLAIYIVASIIILWGASYDEPKIRKGLMLGGTMFAVTIIFWELI